MKELFDEGITAEAPKEYCLICGEILKTEEEKRQGLCDLHIGKAVGNKGQIRREKTKHNESIK